MSSPSSPEDYWLRNELNGILADIPLDGDAGTLEQQLCRDMYLESRIIPFEHFGAKKVVFRTYVDAKPDEKGEPSFVHDLEDIAAIPLAWNNQGVLMDLDGIRNEHDEPERILIAGSLFSVDPRRHFSNAYGVISNEEWHAFDNRQPLIETELNDDQVLICRGGVAVGAHVAYWRVYSLKEIQAIIDDNEHQFIASDFTRMTFTDRENEDLFIPGYLELSTGVVVGADFHTENGEVIRLEM